MSRYREITEADMTPAQRRVHDQIIAGRRGRFGGPFQLLIRAPEICGHAAQLGEHLRWGTSLPDRLSELAIITTARFWRAQSEWYAHAPLAEKGGVPHEASRPSAAAKPQISRNRTKPWSIASAPNCSTPSGCPMRASTKLSPPSAKPASSK